MIPFNTNNFNNTLVLATEIAKVYCDEHERVLYPEVVASVELELRKRLPQHAAQFYNNFRLK